MALKTYKPTTPTRRHTVLLDTSKLTKKKPEKRMTSPMTSKKGRNSQGRITVRHRGGGVKRKYREIDFKQDKLEIKGKIEAIEYDPNRSANIALVLYEDGERKYILAAKGLKEGDTIVAGEDVPIKKGNRTLLKRIPSGQFVHNIELVKGRGGQLARSAGTAAQVQGGEKGYIQLKMPSGEIRLVKEDNYATIGQIGNPDHANIKIGSAGRKRRMGWRPAVRGVARGAHEHPHGGGQGKGGRVGTGGPAKDPWGTRRFTRTRKRKTMDRFIVKRRPTKKGRAFKK